MCSAAHIFEVVHKWRHLHGWRGLPHIWQCWMLRLLMVRVCVLIQQAMLYISLMVTSSMCSNLYFVFANYDVIQAQSFFLTPRSSSMVTSSMHKNVYFVYPQWWRHLWTTPSHSSYHLLNDVWACIFFPYLSICARIHHMRVAQQRKPPPAMMHVYGKKNAALFLERWTCAVYRNFFSEQCCFMKRIKRWHQLRLEFQMLCLPSPHVFQTTHKF